STARANTWDCRTSPRRTSLSPRSRGRAESTTCRECRSARVGKVDRGANLGELLSLLDHVKGLLRLVETHVTPGAVLAVVAGQQGPVPQVLLALTVAVEPIERFGDLVRDLVDPHDPGLRRKER